MICQKNVFYLLKGDYNPNIHPIIFPFFSIIPYITPIIYPMCFLLKGDYRCTCQPIHQSSLQGSGVNSRETWPYKPKP